MLAQRKLIVVNARSFVKENYMILQNKHTFSFSKKKRRQRVQCQRRIPSGTKFQSLSESN